MNEAAMKAAARERRFDVELAQVMGGAAAVPRVPATEPRASLRWARFVALIAACITVALACWQANAIRPLQSPALWEPPTVPGPVPFVQDVVQFASFPATQAALVVLAGDDQVGDLAPLQRFDGLRSLRLMGRGAWRQGSLSPLAALPALEILQLTLGPDGAGERLEELWKAKALRCLELTMQRPFGGADITALRRLPALAMLTVRGGSLDAAAMRELVTLPLQGLALDGVAGCREDVLVQLRAMHTLRHLELSQGLSTGPGATAPAHVGLTPRVAAALAELPLFESLTCHSSVVTAAALRNLPVGLRRLGLLGAPQLGADVFAAVARFDHLHCLELDPGDRASRWPGVPVDAAVETWIAAELAAAPPREPVWAAQAELVRALPLRELRYHGPLPAPVRAALVGRPLRALWLTRAHDDVDVVATLPDLTELTLDSCRLRRETFAITAAAAKNLRVVTLRWVPAPDVALVRELLPKAMVISVGL